MVLSFGVLRMKMQACYFDLNSLHFSRDICFIQLKNRPQFQSSAIHDRPRFFPDSVAHRRKTFSTNTNLRVVSKQKHISVVFTQRPE